MRRGEPKEERVARIHPHAWLWEPLQEDPTFVLRPMFGTKALYLHGRLLFCFAARAEPWVGILVATEREHHASLIAEFPALTPHPILPKWLYLRESADAFESTGRQLIARAKQRDPRLGIVPPARKAGRRKVSRRKL